MTMQLRRLVGWTTLLYLLTSLSYADKLDLYNPATGQYEPAQVGTSGAGNIAVGPGTTGITITQTYVTLAAATSATMIAANTARKYICWMNVGTAPMTVVPGVVTVTAGTGMNYDPGSSAINQGGSFCQDGVSVSKQAFSAISTAGTKVTIWEGQ